jgi:nuclear pore complex protein Nup62
MIDEVNKLSATQQQTAEGDDPVNQLSAILGAHLRALQSIDGNAGRLEDKVIELESRMGHDKGRFGLPRR